MPPANDNVANAVVLSGFSGSTASITIDDATTETGEPIADELSSIHQTIWFSWTASDDLVAVFDTSGSLATDGHGDDTGHLDTTLGIWTATDPSDFTTFVEVGGNDDNDTGSTSRVGFAASSGTTYYIQVGVFGAGYTGTVVLAWDSHPPPPPGTNTSCATALELLGTSGSVDGVSIGWPGVWFIGADPLFNFFEGGVGAPLWYKWTNATGQDVDFQARFSDPASLTSVGPVRVRAGLMIGACGAQALDVGDLSWFGSTVDDGPSGFGQTFDRIVRAGETVYLEVGVYVTTGDTEPPPTTGGDFTFAWAATTATFRDGTEVPVVITPDVSDGALAAIRASVGAGYAFWFGHDSLLANGRIYGAFRIQNTFDLDNNPKIYVASAPINGDSGFRCDFLRDQVDMERYDSPIRAGNTRLVTDGTNVWTLLHYATVATNSRRTCTSDPIGRAYPFSDDEGITHHIDVYKATSDFGWSLVATLDGEESNSLDGQVAYRACAHSGTLWVGWSYFSRKIVKKDIPFVNPLFPLITGVTCTNIQDYVYNYFDRYQITGSATLISRETAISTYSDWNAGKLMPYQKAWTFDMIADDGFPILIYAQPAYAFSQVSDFGPFPNTDGFKVERFDTGTPIAQHVYEDVKP